MNRLGKLTLQWSGHMLASVYRGATNTLVRADQFVGGVLSRTLSAEEQAAVSVGAYAAGARKPKRTQLHRWEKTFFERRLPPAPAHILVGGAGHGREVKALLEIGYTVSAFEPLAIAAGVCAKLLEGTPGLAVQASYEQLCQAADEQVGPAAQLARSRYDAILLGWGSYSHVLRRADRQKLIETCRRLSDGPVLLSYLAAGDQETSKAALVGRALGQSIGSLRKVSTEAVEYAAWSGFVVFIDSKELTEFADLAGYSLVHEPMTTYAHATLIPEESPTAV